MATKSTSTTETVVISVHDGFRCCAGERISCSFATTASLAGHRPSEPPDSTFGFALRADPRAILTLTAATHPTSRSRSGSRLATRRPRLGVSRSRQRWSTATTILPAQGLTYTSSFSAQVVKKKQRYSPPAGDYTTAALVTGTRLPPRPGSARRTRGSAGPAPLRARRGKRGRTRPG